MKHIVILLSILILSGCALAEQNLEFYADTGPELKIEEYFVGPIKAWGIVQDYKGQVTRRFDVDMVGRMDGDTIILDEDFTYYDGELDKRIWRIRKMADGRYQGQADDILGVAEGKAVGSALRFKYEMDLPVGDETYHVQFDDWMYLMNDDVLINRSYIKKFGVTVAELTIVFQKQ